MFNSFQTLSKRTGFGHFELLTDENKKKKTTQVQVINGKSYS